MRTRLVAIYLLFLFTVLNANAQTELMGIIDIDSTLRIENSPFIVVDNVVVTSNGHLTIEKGVQIVFENQKGITVRGTINSIGTEDDKIFFSSTTSIMGSWSGINIRTDLNGSGEFKYSVFKDASNAIQVNCCHGGAVNVSHSTFQNNNVAINGYTGSPIMMIDSCLFKDNHIAIPDANKEITNCTFDGNDYGLYQTEGVNASNSTFINHKEIALWGGRGIINNCEIINNNQAIKSAYNGLNITNSIISNNIKGLETGTDNLQLTPTNSKICDNSEFNFKNNSVSNLDLYGNCWCSTDSTTIENKIIDNFENPSTGEVSYDIYTLDCQTVLQKIDKSKPNTIYWLRENSPICIDENFALNSTDSLLVEAGVIVEIYDNKKIEIQGHIKAIGTLSDSIVFIGKSSHTLTSWQGINIRTDLNGSGNFKYSVFKDASNAIQVNCCHGGAVNVSHSTFQNNNVAINGYTGSPIMMIDSCLFKDNHIAIPGANKEITNCTFDGNDYGLYQTEGVNASNSTFINHKEIALWGARGFINNCEIINNNQAIKSAYNGLNITNSIISNNIKGLETGTDNFQLTPTNSKICDNSEFNFKNNSVSNLDLYGNCWCSTDSTTIENKIIDNFENPSTGEVSYDIYTLDCQIILQKIDKSKPNTIYWLRENSPICIDENFILKSTDSLVVEAGVIVEVYDGKKIEIIGNIEAIGSLSDSIVFVGKSSHTLTTWQGINIRTDLNGSGEFKYSVFKDASNAIQVNCCHGGAVNVSHSTFQNNNVAINGYTGSPIMMIDSCLFKDNYIAIPGANKEIANCIFDGNDYGLFQTEGVNAFNSTFINHKEIAISNSGNATNCLIQNNKIGIISFNNQLHLINSQVLDNEIGVIAGTYTGSGSSLIAKTTSLKSNLGISLTKNKICNNTQYNFYNGINEDLEIYGNCWCSNDSLEVENKIRDGWDDSSIGIVDYGLYGSDCEEQIYKTDKKEGELIYGNVDSHICPKESTLEDMIPAGRIQANEVESLLISSSEIFSGANVRFSSNETVELSSGFQINTGATFQADNNGCEESSFNN